MLGIEPSGDPDPSNTGYEPADCSRGLSFKPLNYTVESRESLTLAPKNVQMTLLLGIF